MADPNEPTHRPGGRGPHSQDDILDAEIVEDHAATGAVGESPGPHSRDAGARADDDADFRQYQQFLEFQKFQEWQRQQGQEDSEHTRAPFAGETTRPRDATSRRTMPWWRRLLGLLRYKAVRRLLYVVATLLFLWWLVHYLFGGWMDNGNVEANGGNGIPGRLDHSTPPITSSDPGAAVTGVYNYIAHTPDVACELFSDAGKQAFATSHGAPDCTTAAQQISASLTDRGQYPNIKLGRDAETTIGRESSVSSCKLAVQGGPSLGLFHLSQNDKGGWIIDGHENEPADCVTG